MVFPARAGMSRLHTRRSLGSRSFPRPRGDEPRAVGAARTSSLFSPPARG